MTSDIADNVLERFLCHVLSLIGVTVEPEDLQACHHMKKQNHFIIKFKCERQKHYALSNRKNLQSKNLVLSPSNFSDKLFQNKHVSRTSPIEVQVSSTEDCQYQHGFIITL